jgi:hypothetical protein
MSDDPMDIQNLAKAASEQLKGVLSQDIIVQQQAHIKKLEAKLAKSVETISLCRKMQAQFAHTEDPLMVLLDTTIAELKGQKDE